MSGDQQFELELVPEPGVSSAPTSAAPEPALTNASPASSAPAAAPAVSSAVPRPGTPARTARTDSRAARAPAIPSKPATAATAATSPAPSPAKSPSPAPPPVAMAAEAAEAAELVIPAPSFAAVIEPVRLSRPVRRLRDFAQLLRLDRPVGTWLLLWPMLWATWIAAEGHPQRRLLAILLAGGVLMRSAGCIINDLADRNIDPHVKRTRSRPLAARAISPAEALTVFGVLAIAALLLVLQLNALTIKLALAGAALTVTYPLFKRFFPLPQLYLGLCFGWAVPMAFAATLATVPRVGWLMLVAAILWAGVYDSEYAMVDRDDDLRIGVRSSAILFGDLDRFMIGAIQLMMLFALLLVGRTLNFGAGYDAGLIAGACCFAWQQWLIRHRDRAGCFAAFQNNNYFGFAVFAGVLLEYSSR